MFTDNINYILDYLLLDVEPHDMVGIKIQNEGLLFVDPVPFNH